MRDWWHRHGLFAGVLTLAAAVRVVVMIGFFPAFVFSDGPTYLLFIDDPRPGLDRTAGYGALLALLHQITPAVWAIAVLQHGLGLLMAVLIYLLLRRWGAGPLVATLATLPVLFDAMELVLEHAVLSDVLFCFLLVLGVTFLGWHRAPTPATAAAGGFVLALAVLVRVTGEPVVLSAVLFCLLAARTWRARAVTALTVCAAFVVPLAGYAVWFDHVQGELALSQAGGRALYMRTTGFVDCSRLTLPSYERTLCPSQPIGKRRDPTHYGWHSPDNTAGMVLPAGVSLNAAFRDFARRAIRAQPGDYARIVARDVWMTFDVDRVDRYEYDTAHKWIFRTYVETRPTGKAQAAYAAHGGRQLTVRQPWADRLASYGDHVYATGPLLLAMLLACLVGLVWRRPGAPHGLRALIVLTGTIGFGLAVVPDLTAEFTWRYVLPAVILLPVGAAAAWVRLRGPLETLSDAPEPRRAENDRTAASAATSETPV